MQVGEKIAADGITEGQAAAAIGVGLATLRKHLAGEYVRSDSAAKYRRWLEGLEVHRALLVSDESPAPTLETPSSDTLMSWQGMEPGTPDDVFRVVDLFSGCGGLSLGFDLAQQGMAFDTVLAVDIEKAMLNVLDNNRERLGRTSVGRLVDLADLTGEAEALAFYLDHLVVTGQADTELESALGKLPRGGLAEFQRSIRALDQAAATQLKTAMASPRFRSAFEKVSSDSIRQTSVISFHESLRLPLPGSRDFRPPILWWEATPAADDQIVLTAPYNVRQLSAARLRQEWDEELRALREKITLSGRGQLASSAHRIKAFLLAVDAGAYDEVKEIWVDWRGQRDALRDWFFENALQILRDAYAPWQVAVLVGGPPCQGFSRIGRGKIRSLRESGVQARVDSEAGDERNRLMFAYVLMVSALQPTFFVFENVRHFQSEVKTPDGVFRAPELLAEAIRDISADHARYEVHSQILSAANHAVPQTRERFFMAGVRDGLLPAPATEIAKWLLTIPQLEPVTLRTALEGLPGPAFAGGGLPMSTACRVKVEPPRPTSTEDATARYLAWVRQELPTGSVKQTDAHVARTSREDDSAWFEMMGPGTRWLDYRVDRSPTLGRLATALEKIQAALTANPQLESDLGIDREELSGLATTVDGSLAIRMLLEGLPTRAGELGHHLLTDNYLAKRDGNHGDWLARLAADQPCKTITSHMGKDTYAYVHPFEARTLSVREAARVQSFPDWFAFGCVSLVDGYRVIGNAVPPLLSNQIAERIFLALAARFSCSSDDLVNTA